MLKISHDLVKVYKLQDEDGEVIRIGIYHRDKFNSHTSYLSIKNEKQRD